MHPESANVTIFWRSKLPLEKTLQTMTRYAIPFIHEENMSRKDLILSLYTGHDQHHTPYAQLTEKGALQLQSVGRELRRRYIGSLLPEKVEEASSVLFCRSTNICRTVQSLRSLLVGMYGDTHESSPSFLDSKKGTENRSTVNSNIADGKRDRKLPFISTRHKSFETMFPHADGPCQHMSERRVKLYHQFVNSTALLKWGDLEKRMLEFIGSSHKRIGWLTWLNILDVFTCFQAHGVEFPLGITKVDLQDITELVAWTWDVLYAVRHSAILSHFILFFLIFLMSSAVCCFLCQLYYDLSAARFFFAATSALASANACLTNCLFICLFIFLSYCLSVCLPACRSVCLSAWLSVCLSVYSLLITVQLIFVTFMLFLF